MLQGGLVVVANHDISMSHFDVHKTTHLLVCQNCKRCPQSLVD
jgi:hypothetical protein